MAKNIYNGIFIAIGVLITIGIIYNLLTIRKEKLNNNMIKRNITIARIFIIILIVLYTIYGILRNYI